MSTSENLKWKQTLEYVLQLQTFYPVISFSEIGLAFNTLGKDPDCRVIILSGNGKAFCSGIDLKDLMDVGNIINSDEDTARKSLKLFNIVKDYQNWFMEMEKVGIYELCKVPCLNPYITSVHFWTFRTHPPTLRQQK